MSDKPLTCSRCKKKGAIGTMCHIWGKTICPKCVEKKLMGGV